MPYRTKKFDPAGIEYGAVAAPAARRTTAEHHYPEESGWLYDGMGGLSLAVPYVAGVLAIGWQVAPDMEGQAMLDLLYRTGHYDAASGIRVIDPPAFIAALEIREETNESLL